jgi:hypothetical protein
MQTPPITLTETKLFLALADTTTVDDGYNPANRMVGKADH